MMRAFWRDAMRNAYLSLRKSQDWFGSASERIGWKAGIVPLDQFRSLADEDSEEELIVPIPGRTLAISLPRPDFLELGPSLIKVLVGLYRMLQLVMKNSEQRLSVIVKQFIKIIFT
jgi:hypothetical protein